MLIDILLILVAIISLIISASMIAHIWFGGVPYVPTKWEIVEEMIRLAELEGKEVVYDIGAGDGRLLRAAKQANPNIRAVGYEIIPTICVWGRFLAWWQGLHIELRLRDAFAMDFSDADVVFLYLFPDVLKKLAVKFDKELQPGTRVISHAFTFPDKEPIGTINIPCGRRERTINVYEW